MASRKHKTKARPPQPKDLAPGLNDLAVARKSSRLFALWPAIEEKLAQGVSHAQILKFLNKKGFALTERTYKSYVYRFRKRGREKVSVAERSWSSAPIGTLSLQAGSIQDARKTMEAPADLQRSRKAMKAGDAGRRPPSFDFNPAGISPDLLK